ncbi:MAG TPA: hypothetical protein VHD39_06895 [Acidimicrobiales bacterium]|nr:hypothetical protein [Acidimicrobiales bacterium]
MPLLLAACGSGSGPGGGSSGDAAASLQSASANVQTAMRQYQATVAGCKRAAKPVVCLESADRTLGGKIHDFANVLAVGRGFDAPAATLTAARNAAQTLANSLEILGDAEPTQANYDQVLNNFNVASAIAQLQRAVHKLG